jgi:hypothetical protein
VDTYGDPDGVLATVGKICIRIDREDGMAVFVLDGSRQDGPFGRDRMDELLKRVPALQKEENLAVYASVVLILEFGDKFSPLTDDDAIETFRAGQFGERARFDLSEIRPPQIQDDQLVFFAEVVGLGRIPYRIIVPYPYRRKTCRAEILPFKA